MLWEANMTMDDLKKRQEEYKKQALEMAKRSQIKVEKVEKVEKIETISPQKIEQSKSVETDSAQKKNSDFKPSPTEQRQKPTTKPNTRTDQESRLDSHALNRVPNRRTPSEKTHKSNQNQQQKATTNARQTPQTMPNAPKQLHPATTFHSGSFKATMRISEGTIRRELHKSSQNKPKKPTKPSESNSISRRTPHQSDFRPSTKTENGQIGMAEGEDLTSKTLIKPQAGTTSEQDCIEEVPQAVAEKSEVAEVPKTTPPVPTQHLLKAETSQAVAEKSEVVEVPKPTPPVPTQHLPKAETSQAVAKKSEVAETPKVVSQGLEVVLEIKAKTSEKTGEKVETLPQKQSEKAQALEVPPNMDRTADKELLQAELALTQEDCPICSED